MTAKPDLLTISFASRDGWEAWLAEHHADSDRLWLKIAKKGSGVETVTQPEALEVEYGVLNHPRGACALNASPFERMISRLGKRAVWHMFVSSA